MRRTILFFLAVLLLCTVALAAAEPDIGQEEVYRSIPPEAGRLMDDGVQSSFSEGAAALVRNVFPEASQAMADSVRNACLMLCALLLCSLMGQSRAASLAGVLCICSAGALSVNSLASSGSGAVYQMQEFSAALLPAMTAGTVAVGGITASAAIYAGTALFSDLLMHIMGDLLLPVIYCYVALRAAQAMCENELLERLSKLVKWCFQGGIKLILFLFTAYLTVTGLVTGTADATVVKAAKLTLSGVVPVVGSMISDASETVVVGAAAVRNAVGIAGMLAAIAICLVPFVRTAAQYLVLKAACAAGGVLGQPRLLGLMDAFCEAMGFILSILAACALMLLISCVCYLKVLPQ